MMRVEDGEKRVVVWFKSEKLYTYIVIIRLLLFHHKPGKNVNSSPSHEQDMHRLKSSWQQTLGLSLCLTILHIGSSQVVELIAFRHWHVLRLIIPSLRLQNWQICSFHTSPILRMSLSFLQPIFLGQHFPSSKSRRYFSICKSSHSQIIWELVLVVVLVVVE